MANMPFYIVYSKANCTTNSLQACNKAVLLFGVVLAKVKYPATKIIRYVENHPEKMGETWALGQSCLLAHAKDLYKYKPTRPGPAHFFFCKSNTIFRHYIIQVCEPIISSKRFSFTLQ